MQPLFQVDAFTDKLFGGNPAGVCPLSSWLPDDNMQSIAMENNLAETAFFVPTKNGIDLRWFTPAIEVDLCGHATLATAHILFTELDWPEGEITFSTRSGDLTVKKYSEDQYLMDFPSDHISPMADLNHQKTIIDSIGITPEYFYKGKDDFVAVLADEKNLLDLQPDFRKVATLPSRGLLVTTPGTSTDFSSRGFFPQCGIDEDPATGSAHTALTPYWAMRLQKNSLSAVQLSPRRGHLSCVYKGDRTLLIGGAVTYLRGSIHIS